MTGHQGIQCRTKSIDDSELASLLRASFSGFFLCAYLIFLYGLCFHSGVSTLLLLGKILLLSFLLSFAPPVAALRLSDRYQDLGLQTGLLNLSALAILCLLGVLQAYIHLPLLVIVGIGDMFCLFEVLRLIRRRRLELEITPNALVCFAALGLFIAVAVWDGFYIPYDAVQSAMSGQIHLDYVFHSAICGMIKTYGIPSGGLHGATFHAYHWGTHWIVAQLVELLGCWCTEGFSLLVPILFSSWLLTSLLQLSAQVRLWYFGFLPNGQTYGLLAAICLVSGGLPMRAFQHAASWPDNVLISQSYLLSIVCLYFMLSASLEVSRSNSALFRKVFLGAVLPILFGVIAFLKISAALISGVIMVLLAAVYRLYRQKNFALAVCFMLIISGFIKLFAMQAGEPMNFEWFSYIKRYSKHPFNYLGIHFLYLWLLVFWGAFQVFDSDVNRRKKAGLIVISVFATALVGGLIPNLLSIRDGSGFYFSDPHRCLVLAAFASLVLGKNRNVRFLMFILTTIVIASTYENIRVRSEIRETQNGRKNAKPSQTQEFHSALSRILELRQLTPSERRLSCVFMPGDAQMYWSGFYKRPDAAPYVIPALSEMFMIRGVPTSLLNDSRWGSLEGYSLRSYRELNLDAQGAASISMVLDEARTKNCKRLYEFNSATLNWNVHDL